MAAFLQSMFRSLCISLFCVPSIGFISYCMPIVFRQGSCLQSHPHLPSSRSRYQPVHVLFLCFTYNSYCPVHHTERIWHGHIWSKRKLFKSFLRHRDNNKAVWYHANPNYPFRTKFWHCYLGLHSNEGTAEHQVHWKTMPLWKKDVL